MSWQQIFLQGEAYFPTIFDRLLWSLMLTSVYKPNDHHHWEEIWRELDSAGARWACSWCLGGNWDIIRFPDERLDSCRISSDKRAFSAWINLRSLMDLQLNGVKVTWSSNQSPSISQLNKFHAYGNWYPDVSDWLTALLWQIPQMKGGVQLLVDLTFCGFKKRISQNWLILGGATLQCSALLDRLQTL